MAKQENSLAHTKWLCKYHIVFTPKYRRKIIYNQYWESIGKILRQLVILVGAVIEQIERIKGDEVVEKAQCFAELLEEQLQEMQTLVHDLVDTARLEGN